MEFRHKSRGWIVKTTNENVQQQFTKRNDIWEEITRKKGKKKK
jgi:hypothetical protein